MKRTKKAAKAKKETKMAETVSLKKPLIVAALVALTLMLELLSRNYAGGASLGNGFQLAALPALVALFLLGYDYAIYTIALSALLLPLLGATDFEAIARLTSWLPIPIIAAFTWLAAEGKWRNRTVSAMFFGFFAALLMFQVAAIFAPALISNPFVPVPQMSAATGAQRLVFLTLGDVFLGAFPVAMLAAFAGMLLIYWLRSEVGKPDLLLGDMREICTLGLIAVPIKAAATAAVFFYYAGPSLSGMAPELLLYAQPLGTILVLACAGGVVELLAAWALSKAIRRYRFW